MWSKLPLSQVPGLHAGSCLVDEESEAWKLQGRAFSRLAESDLRHKTVKPAIRADQTDPKAHAAPFHSLSPRCYAFPAWNTKLFCLCAQKFTRVSVFKATPNNCILLKQRQKWIALMPPGNPEYPASEYLVFYPLINAFKHLSIPSINNYVICYCVQAIC